MTDRINAGEVIEIGVGLNAYRRRDEMLTANDALDIIAIRAQWCRENGESDMRNILNTVGLVKRAIKEGKTRDEILAEYFDDEDDE